MSGCADAGCGCGCGAVLTIRWQRLVADAGGTCPRCGTTGDAVADAARRLTEALAPLGITVEVETAALDDATFRRDPSQSNRIWLAGRPIEEWLDAGVGSSTCCDECGDAECRTMHVGGAVHEAIPADVIVRAGLMAAASLLASAG